MGDDLSREAGEGAGDRIVIVEAGNQEDLKTAEGFEMPAFAVGDLAFSERDGEKVFLFDL